MIRVTLEGLVKKFGAVAALDGASLEIAPGELAFLVGGPGSGKTTLARVIAGLDPLDDGEIFFDDRLIHRLPPGARPIGLVWQDDALWPRLTVAETIALGLQLRGQGLGRAAARERVAEALNILHLDGLAGRRPDQLAPLDRQRVALARLGDCAELLLIDEPLARLDGLDRDAFRADLRRLHDETEVTTLVLTRDPGEALRLADRLAVLDAGKVVQAGAPHAVYNRPVNAFVARCLGPVNLLEGEIESGDARGEVVVRTPVGRLVGRDAGGSLAAGSAVTVAIRPESLALGPAPADANRIPATVGSLVLEGPTQQVHLHSPGDRHLVALTLQSQTRGLRVGQSVTLSVPPELVVVLPGKYALVP